MSTIINLCNGINIMIWEKGQETRKMREEINLGKEISSQFIKG